LRAVPDAARVPAPLPAEAEDEPRDHAGERVRVQVGHGGRLQLPVAGASLDALRRVHAAAERRRSGLGAACVARATRRAARGTDTPHAHTPRPNDDERDWVRRASPERLETMLADLTGFTWTRDPQDDEDDADPNSD